MSRSQQLPLLSKAQAACVAQHPLAQPRAASMASNGCPLLTLLRPSHIFRRPLSSRSSIISSSLCRYLGRSLTM